MNTPNNLPGDRAKSAYRDGQTSINNDAIELAAQAYAKDLKWRRIFRFALMALVFAYLVASVNMAAQDGAISASQAHTALVELRGGIGIQEGVTADQINQSLREAFEAPLSEGVILRIDSPGGTPVQSAEINAEMTRLRAIYPNKPLHVVINELCASGGYYVAVAADKIFAHPSSIVGSIGVRMDSFGFVDAMEKLGIERRTLTAGENKALLDPFAPQSEAQRAHLQSMLDDVHQQFIDAVRAGRGDRLVEDSEIFTGLVWSGAQAKAMGLVDDFGSVDEVARQEFGLDTVVDYTYRPDFFERLSQDLGVSIGVGVVKALGLETKMQ